LLLPPLIIPPLPANLSTGNVKAPELPVTLTLLAHCSAPKLTVCATLLVSTAEPTTLFSPLKVMVPPETVLFDSVSWLLTV